MYIRRWVSKEVESEGGTEHLSRGNCPPGTITFMQKRDLRESVWDGVELITLATTTLHPMATNVMLIPSVETSLGAVRP